MRIYFFIPKRIHCSLSLYPAILYGLLGSVEIASSCSSVDNSLSHVAYPTASVFTGDERHTRTLYISRKKKEMHKCLFCQAQTFSRELWMYPSKERGLDPHAGFESRRSNCFCLLLTFLLSHILPTTTPPSTPLILSNARCQKTWHLTALASTQEQRKGEKLYHPVGLIEDISEALGVRHPSSSSLHRRLYKQVSNTTDLVWQTFSKEHLKRR